MENSITVLPSGLKVTAETGTNLLECLHDQVSIRAECGGRGVCGKCLVQLDGEIGIAPVSEVEKSLIPANRIDAGYRLACQVNVAGSMRIRILTDPSETGHVKTKSIPCGTYSLDPEVRRTLISAEELPPSYSGTLSDEVSGFTVITRKTPGTTKVISGSHPTSLGLAVDIGTTTVAAYLCDLDTANILSSAAIVNPQRRYGEDVINRIQAASRPGGLLTLQKQISDAIGYLAGLCLNEVRKRPEDIDDIVVTGNTAMQHIFTGTDPELLARIPFEPKDHKAMILDAASIGLTFSPGAQVYVMPVISGFAGGDIIACGLADRILEQEQLTLIIDVGTNGELLLGNRDGLWSTSCATGPAFEGAQIACGMRAATGAISACTYNEERQDFEISLINEGPDVKPQGICGSGVIDAVLALRNAGMVMPSGKMKSRGTGDESDRIILVDGGEDQLGCSIYISQNDIRQVQLAKAALATGIICLMEKAGITRVDRTILTGAFGSAFNWRHATAIGMLPDASIMGRIITRSNLAGEGAVMALLDRRKRKEANDIRLKTTYLHLADDPSFIRRFVSQTLFP